MPSAPFSTAARAQSQLPAGASSSVRADAIEFEFSTAILLIQQSLTLSWRRSDCQRASSMADIVLKF